MKGEGDKRILGFVLASEPEIGRHLLWSALAVYLGGVVGVLVSNSWHWEFAMLNPLNVLAAFMGGLLAPGVQILVIAGCILGAASTAIRLPRWYLILVAGWSGEVVALARWAWRSP